MQHAQYGHNLHVVYEFNYACEVRWVTKSVFPYSNGCSKTVAGHRRIFGGPRAARLPLVAPLTYSYTLQHLL